MLRGSRQRPKYKQAVDYYTWKFQQALATKPAFRVRFRKGVLRATVLALRR